MAASGEGAHIADQLDPGTYTVTVTAPGHKTFTADDVKIDICKVRPPTGGGAKPSARRAAASGRF